MYVSLVLDFKLDRDAYTVIVNRPFFYATVTLVVASGTIANSSIHVLALGREKALELGERAGQVP